MSNVWVVPLVGTWIEIEKIDDVTQYNVVPLVGTWIEMVITY